MKKNEKIIYYYIIYIKYIKKDWNKIFNNININTNTNTNNNNNNNNNNIFFEYNIITNI